jgi:hypothetical protein
MRPYLSSIIFAIAILCAAFFLGTSYRYKFKSSETIEVTGLAEKSFMSDQVIWHGTYTRQDFDLKTAYAAIKQDEQQIRAYLTASGIPASSCTFSAVDVQRMYNTQTDAQGNSRENIFAGYRLSAGVTVDSKELEKVERMSREITALLEKGIELNSPTPDYYFSGLNALKIDLLAKASADARARAESIASNAHATLGELRKATMGVFQITGKTENENYSYGGAFNTSSKEKKASITIRAAYQVE